LDVDNNKVLQVAMLVTDEQLNVISTDFNTVINQNEQVLDGMNDWCKENLKSLADESRKSSVTEQKAEEDMLQFISQYVEPRKSPLAGNTIYMDRMFLRKYFPRVDEYLHYRIIDVSTVKELCGRWNKKAYNSAPKKLLKHRALDDIKESINELKHYKDNFFNATN
jgi:oligoribonuclease